MQPLKLTLKGFRGIRDGLGQEEITLDLERLADGAELIAIAGANGSGKTTIMDNLTPYNLLPSRAATAGPGGFTFYDHVYLPESVKDLTWAHEGRCYRSQIVIRMSGRRKTEAFLLGLDDDGQWRPVRVDDGTVSDGRVESYTRCVECICGSPETFFTSVFASQGKRQYGEFFIPDHRKGERQRYCCAADCRRASKAASQAAWLARPANNDYFSGPVHVARVQAWRAAHPGYSRGRARPSRALQDLLTPQVPDAIEECANRVEAAEAGAVVALQDLLHAESPLLAGLVVAHLFQPALQDDMASTTRRLVQLGRDVINGRCGEDHQATTSARAAAPGPPAVQLGWPT